MSSITGFSRKNLGPLTTTHSLPSSCAVAVQECSTCTQAWQGQTCFGQSTGVADNADCWPPRTPSVSTPPPPLNGWGFYSPGLACPAGMTSACSATGGQPASWTVQFSLLNQETAVGCCPSGFSCTNNGLAQTCQQTATKTSFPAVACESGTSGGFTFLAIPETITPTSDTVATTISQYMIYAPLIQLNWQASDLTSATSSSTPSIPASASTLSPTAAPSSGLSSGAKAGIGIGVALGALAVLALAFFIYKRRQNAYALAKQHSPVESPYELQAGKKGSYAVPELPSGTQVSELEPGGVKAETRQVHETGS